MTTTMMTMMTMTTMMTMMTMTTMMMMMTMVMKHPTGLQLQCSYRAGKGRGCDGERGVGSRNT